MHFLLICIISVVYKMSDQSFSTLTELYACLILLLHHCIQKLQKGSQVGKGLFVVLTFHCNIQVVISTDVMFYNPRNIILN